MFGNKAMRVILSALLCFMNHDFHAVSVKEETETSEPITISEITEETETAEDSGTYEIVVDQAAEEQTDDAAEPAINEIVNEQNDPDPEIDQEIPEMKEDESILDPVPETPFPDEDTEDIQEQEALNEETIIAEEDFSDQADEAITEEESEEMLDQFNAENEDYRYSENEDGTITIDKYLGDASNIVVPYSIDGKLITIIGEYAFSNNQKLEGIVIPDSVVMIEDEAFYGCTKLENVTFSATLERIGTNAFSRCGSIRYLYFPSNLISIGSYAFGDCTSLVRANIPESVEVVGVGAFSGCTNLIIVTLYSGTSVYEGSFSYCPKLKTAGEYDSEANVRIEFTETVSSMYQEAKLFEYVEEIELPETVTTIDTQAFYRCENLRNITLPETITSIGKEAFSGCTQLTGISFPMGTVSVLNGAFSSCTNLTKVVIPNSETSFAYGAFKDCTSLTTAGPVGSDAAIELEFTETITNKYTDSFLFAYLVEINVPDTVTAIGDSAFSGSTNLVSFIISEHVTSIGNYAFNKCSSLSGIIFPESVTSIGESAFQDCANLSKVVMPASVTSIGKGAFLKCEKLKTAGPIGSGANIEVEFGTEITGLYSGKQPDGSIYSGGLFHYLEEISIPEYVTSIGDYGFSYCIKLESFVVPEHITNIGINAFHNCKNLSSVVIAENVTNIGGGAFSDCQNLSSLIIPKSEITLGKNAFYNCSSLKSAGPIGNDANVQMAFPDTITQALFRDSSLVFNLEEITIPDNVTEIGKNAFFGGWNLTSIVIPENVTTIGSYAFRECGNLTDVTINGVVKTIGDNAFYGCSKLQNINFPEGLETIGANAFYSCRSLETVVLPDSLEFLNDGVFKYCTSLKSIRLPANLKSVGAFEGCNSLSEITLPDSLTSIGNNAFCDCTALTSIKIPDHVKSLGNYAFKNCTGLQIMELPEGLTSIGSEAFSNCTNLETVDLPDSLTSIGNSTFMNCAKLTNIDADASVTIGIKAFFNCKGLQTVRFIYITSVGTSAFEGCTNLKSVEYINARTIDSNAFKDCENLSSVEMSNDLITVGIGAFLNCPESLTVHYYGSESTFNEKVTIRNNNEPFINAQKVFGQDVESLKITVYPITVGVGQTQTVQLQTVPSDINYKYFKWYSHSPEIAAIDHNGIVTGLKSGQSRITVTALGNRQLYDQCYVYVRGTQVTEVIVTSPKNTIAKNEMITLTAEVLPADAEDKKVYWSSSNPGVASVDSNGNVTGISSGTTVITASAGNGMKGSVSITVGTPVSGLVIEEDDIRVSLNNTAEIRYTVIPEDADNKKVTWSSEDPAIASVNGSVITAISEGTTTITGITEDGGFTARMTVTAYYQPVTAFHFEEEQVDIKFGESKTLKYVLEPDNASDKSLIWVSVNSEIASAGSDGVLQGNKPGKTVITAISADGFSSDCHVTVQFADVTDHSVFYYPFVYDMVERGVVGGYDDGTFRPTANCNRAAVVTFLWRLSGKPAPTKMAEFKDMTGNSDFDKAISWAAENNITTGWADNTFRPWNTCNRAAVMTFLWRAAGKPVPTKMASFKDMTGNTDFDTAISWASENGITTGWADNTFRPWNTCNRLAVVSFLARYDALD